MSDSLLKQTTDHHESKMASSGGGGGGGSGSSSATTTEEVAITIEEPWITSLEQTLDDFSSNYMQDYTTPKLLPTIFKVPEGIRTHDRKAYEPTMVSLGPYHHKKEQLQPMKKLKLYYLRKFLNRNAKYSFADYIGKIQEREGGARSTYSEQVDMGSHYFVRLMLLDCCFVLEIISSIVRLPIAEERDMVVDDYDTWLLEELVVNPIISTPCSRTMLARDMLLIENQLPFFLLQLLFDRVRYKHGANNLSRLVLFFFDSQTGWPMNIDFSTEEIHHFLHLLHSSIAPPPPLDGDDQSSMGYFPSATQLKGAGVHFKKKKLDSKEKFLCVTYDKGKLEIPQLNVGYKTNILFRNLIAFEQCYYKLSRQLHTGVENNFTAYAFALPAERGAGYIN